MFIIISNFVILVLLYYLGYNLLTIKHENKLINMFIFFIIFLLCSLTNYSGASGYKSLILFIFYICFTLLLFKGDLKNLFNTLIVFIIIVTFSEIFVGFIMNVLIDLNQTTSLVSIKYAISLIFSQIMAFILSYSYIKLNKNLNIHILPRYTWLIFVLPITTIILLVNIRDYYDLMKNNIIIFIVILGLFISNFITIYIFLFVIQSITMKKQIENFNIQKQFISSHLSSQFDYLHTVINKLKNILDTSNENKNILVKNEIEDLMNFTYEQFNLLYTNSIALNTVINDKIDDLHRYDITFDHTIMYMDFDYLDFITQIDLFTYLIDIGIEANKNKSHDKNIILKSRKQNNQLMISETFTISTEIKNIEEIKNKIYHILKNTDINVSIRADSNKFIIFILVHKDNRKKSLQT